jgi:hypothetical protein
MAYVDVNDACSAVGDFSNGGSAANRHTSGGSHGPVVTFASYRWTGLGLGESANTNVDGVWQ